MLTHQDSFEIGYVTKTKGLKGEIQIFFQYEDVEDIDFEFIFIEIDAKLVPFFINSYQLLGNGAGYFYLEDVTHIDKAEELVKKKVFLPNEHKPVRDPEDFRITDLKGFTVHEKKHGVLGEILEVNEFPQQFIATIRYQEKEVLFPLSDDFIRAIDREEKRLEIELPDGLLDIYLD